MADTVHSEGQHDTFTLGETRALLECAYAAGSGRPSEAAREIFSQLSPVLHQDAAALLAWDSSVGQHVVLGSSGYGEATLAGLGEPYAQTEPHRRMLQEHQPLRIADLPYDYRRTSLYEEVLRPAGFSDGMSSCLFTRDGRYAGMLHFSAESPVAFASKHVQLVSALTASLGQLCNLRRLSSVLLPVDPLSRASVVDSTGRARPVEEYEPATCVEDPDFRRLSRHLLVTPSGALTGLWPSRAGWLALRIERVHDPLHEDRVALLVTESTRDAPYGLSARELDVLNGLARGASNQKIASERSISLRTVTTHVERILEKLGEESRAGAASKATREGLLRLDLMAAARP